MASERRLTPYSREFLRLYQVGDETAAIEVAIEALATEAAFSPSFESVAWLADELRQRRLFGLALKLVESAAERGYRGWRIDYLRGLFHALNRNPEQAIDLFDKAMNDAPEEMARRIELLKGRLYAVIGAYEDARKCFESSLSIGRDPERYADKAIRLAWSTRQYELAIRWAWETNSAYGPSTRRTVTLAQCYFSLGKWKYARQTAERGLQSVPNNCTLRRLLGVSLVKERKLVLAINKLDEQVRLDPEWDEGKIILAQAFVECGRQREALDVLNLIQGAARHSDEVTDLVVELAGADGAILPETESNDRKRSLVPVVLVDPEVRYCLNNVPDDFTPSWTPEVVAASGNMVRAFHALVHSVRTIVLREVLARFGRHEIGYLWAIFEPLVHVAVLSFIFYFMRMRDTLGMNVVLFVATGIIPLLFYLKTYGVLTNALKQNKPLLNHAGVQPMDIFLARSVLEFFTQLFVLLLFAVAIFLFVEKYSFGSALSVLANIFGLWIAGIGAGLLVGSLVVFAESLPNIVAGFNRLIYITSGVFFTLDMMPPSVAEYAAYNPLLHFVDGVRGNFNPLMGGSRIDITYGFAWAFSLLALGLIADRALRHRVLDR